MKKPKKLKDLKVFRVSLVDKPAVPKAMYHIIKSALEEGNMTKVEELLIGLGEKVDQQNEVIKAQQVEINELREAVEKVDDGSDEGDALLTEVLAEIKDMSSDISPEALASFTNTIDTLMEVGSND